MSDVRPRSVSSFAAIFNQPVMASEYPDYHQIVSTPMDLGTIQVRDRIHQWSLCLYCPAGKIYTSVFVVMSSSFLLGSVRWVMQYEEQLWCHY